MALINDWFDDESLNPAWTTATTTGGSISETGDNLVIDAGDGLISTGTFNPNWVYQDVPFAEDFDVVTSWDLTAFTTDESPTDRSAGMVYQFSATEYMWLSYVKDGSQEKYYHGYKDGNSNSDGTGTFNCSDLPYLRIKKVGDVITTYRSSNGTSWTQDQSNDFGSTAAGKIGCFANYNPANASDYIAYVDYFVQPNVIVTPDILALTLSVQVPDIVIDTTVIPSLLEIDITSHVPYIVANITVIPTKVSLEIVATVPNVIITDPENINVIPQTLDVAIELLDPYIILIPTGYIDIGIRFFDGVVVRPIVVKTLNPAHKLRVGKDSITYGIPLVVRSADEASPFIIYDGIDNKALPQGG